MKLATFRAADDESFGIVRGEQVIDLRPVFAESADAELTAVGDLLQMIQAGPAAIERAAGFAAGSGPDRGGSSVYPLDSVQLLAPIPRPPKVLCVGRNYRDHVGEMSAELPPFPSTFAKFPSNVIGTGAPIMLPSMSSKVDYEAELAVVIGRHAKHVPVDDALAYVAGYAILHDVSARDIQIEQKQLTIGKNFRTFAPFGPWITTPDEAGDAANLSIRLWLNGQLMQDGNTHDLIFSTAHIIAFLSEVTDLEPGDVISTGTPAGVGMGRTPQVFLKPGDTVTVEVEGLGRIENPVVAEAADDSGVNQ
jgi:2-keto-4-pentenoate hydratase/2-oxohepta-3-ene-1,7-dioic acid hydratase in catechol pathway